ncbi:MAG: hypothetical protein JWM80_3925 [Cyanobacteria bacterium RYN_339]|nr:hypothetical protein [Cyanobacteria bacterium RYN_339]
MALERNEQLMTFAEYRELPEGCYNLIEGHLIMTPAPSLWHQCLSSRLNDALKAYVSSRNLGWVYYAPLDVILSETFPPIVMQPDVLFVARDGEAQRTSKGIAGPPALVIEVLSPSNQSLDAIKKRALYERFGVQEYWMVLPDMAQVEVLRREGERFARPLLLEAPDVLATPLLPGFGLDLAGLFAPED